MRLGTYLLAAAAALDSAVFAYPWRENPWTARPGGLPSTERHTKRSAPAPAACAPNQEVSVKAPRRNIFNGLDGKEVADVTSFLHKQKSLNLTAAGKATR